MNILDDNNSIRFGSFKCLDSDKVYIVTSTLSTFDLSDKHWTDKALKAEDTIKRDDGESRKLMRSQLRSRFTNIEEYKQKPK
tara:strand:- start:645 stop:890 length:246 start_codon:yes stop_codon:yes gene_type:complete